MSLIFSRSSLEASPRSIRDKESRNEEEANCAIENDDPKMHFLKPEVEIRNYFNALNLLEEKLKDKVPVPKELILEIQAVVEDGASKEKIGLRGPMPPGVLFAVYDSVSGKIDYIPPEYSDIPTLLDELVEYINTSDDHPLIKAAVMHYQLVTIHTFEDGYGRTARLISSYVMDYYGYGFGGIGSLEEYFQYNQDEYYSSLQMGLPALYYESRNNPPHPEIWVEYFLRMVLLYSKRVCEISQELNNNGVITGLSYLGKKEKEFLYFLVMHRVIRFKPVDMSAAMKVSNRTIINWSVALVKQGFLVPEIVKKRVLSYSLSEYSLNNRDQIIELIEDGRLKR